MARAMVRDRVVTIHAHRFLAESVRLETLRGVEPYLEGLRRYREEQRKREE